MVKFLIEDNLYFDISDFEIKKSGLSWIIDMFEYFLFIYERVYFIIGSDNFLEIVKWYKVEEILRRYFFIVFL